MLRIRVRRTVVLAAGLSLASGAPGSAQSAGPVGEVIEQLAIPPPPLSLLHSARDSARVLGDARSAQRRFERIRRNHFPWTDYGLGGDCDEIVGRFCLLYDGVDEELDLPPESDEVAEARFALIEALDRAAALLPTDGWVAGQRVRYLAEAERFADAIAAAHDCRAPEPGWCSALAGFAHHAAGEWAQADSAYSEAIEAMPAEVRDRWADPSVLIDGGWDAYRSAPEAARDSLARRFWWLADPLWTLPGNDRRTEHFTRWVMDRLQDRAESSDGISWGSDLRELILRYGWAAGWERVRPRPGRMGPASVVIHHKPKQRRFVPPVDFITDPYEVGRGEWALRDESARAGYSPLYASSVEPLEHQLAVFHRADSILVVAGYELPDSVELADATVDAALVLARDELAVPIVVRAEGAGRTGSFAGSVPEGPVVVSIEAVTGEGGLAGRARYGINPPPVVPGVARVSDLLLLNDSDPLPESLTEALPGVRGSSRARGGERIVIYWEIYGIDRRTDAMEVSLTMRDADPGLLRRVAESIGLVRELRPIRLSWQEAPPDERGTMRRSLAVELPQVSPGPYTLELTIKLPGREPMTAAREIQIEG